MPDPSILRGHIVAADAMGQRVDPFDCVASNAEIFEKLDATCDAHSASKARRVFVHIHGGRVNAKKAHIVAEDAVLRMRSEDDENWMYPIFLTWPSGDLSTVWDHLTCLRRGDPWPRMGPVTAPLVFLADVAGGVAKAPRSLLYMWLGDLGVALQVLGWKDGDSLMPSWRESSASIAAAKKNGFHLRPGTYERGFLDHTGRFLAYLVTFPLKIITEITILDGIGNGAWRAMYHNVLSTVRRPQEFRYSHRPSGGVGGPATGAFAKFFDDLTKHVQEEGVDKYEVTLVAHSMGAIAINRLLLDGSVSKLPIKNVVYMAPACTVAEGANAFRHLAEASQGEGPKFYLLTLHPMADAQETQWTLADIVPRGSLLEWIDNWYSEPRHPLERVMGKWVNATRALPLFDGIKERFFLRAFDCMRATDVTTHGGFNGRRFWRRDFWWPSS